MKNSFNLCVATSIISIAFIGCGQTSSNKVEKTIEKESASITKSIESYADYSTAKTSADSLAIIKANLKSTGTNADCCCKYYNNGSYHYESTSKSSCEYVGGECVDASNCK